MTLDEFVQKYIGTTVDFDGHYGGQCVDLYRLYVQQVLGFPQSPLVVGAKDIWDTAPEEYYEKIKCMAINRPQLGDIVVWNEHTGKGYGHVAVCLYAHVSVFCSLDQNWPEGKQCARVFHDYQHVIGWLRPKGTLCSKTQDRQSIS